MRGGRRARRRRRVTALVRSVEDADAFHEFYDGLSDRVAIYFTRRTFDGELAHDLTAETFAVALARRREFRGTTDEEAEAWLFRIARTQLNRYWRAGAAERAGLERLRLEPPEPDDADIRLLEREAGLPALRRELTGALGRLPEDQAYAVQEHVMRERSYADLASEIGVTEQVVRARVSRGLRALASSLERLRVEDVA